MLDVQVRLDVLYEHLHAHPSDARISCNAFEGCLLSRVGENVGLHVMASLVLARQRPELEVAWRCQGMQPTQRCRGAEHAQQ